MSNEDALELFHYIYGDHTYKVNCLIKNGNEPRYYSVRFDNLKRKTKDVYLVRWREWKEQTGEDWQKRILATREKWLKRQAEFKAQRLENEKGRKQFFSNLVKYTKILIYLPIGAVAVYLLYWLGLLGIVIVENWSSIAGIFLAILYGIWSALPWVFLVIAGLLALSFLIGGAVVLLKKCSFPGKELFKKSFGAAWSPFRSVGGFFAMYFRAFKDDHCPSIEWEE